MRFALVLLLLLLAATAYTYASAPWSAHVIAAAPALQATASSPAAPTPIVSGAPAAAPISDSTQQVLLIIGFAVLSVALISGGIYLRRRWIATRY
jgi:hypothetical protein